MTHIQTNPSHKPQCPNHGCALEGCGFPLPKRGTGRCPVSGASFDLGVDIQEGEMEMVKDKFGVLRPKPADWKVIGND